jgi:ATP-binding cassette subfamily B protein
MPLIEITSESVRRSLGVDGDGANGKDGTEHPDGLIAAVEADLTAEGTYGTEWMVVTRDTLRVYEPNGAGPKMRLDVPLKELKSPQTESLVGGSALQAVVDGKPVEIIRYSNGKQVSFSRIAKYLDDVAKHEEKVAKGEEVKEEPKFDEDVAEPKRCPKCNLLLPDGSKVCPACMSKGRVLLRLFDYLRPYRPQIAVLSVLMVVGTIAGLVSPYLTRPLFDRVLAPRGPGLPFDERVHLLGMIVLGMLGAGLFSQCLNIVQGRVAVWLTHKLAHSLRVQLYEHLQLLSLRYFDKRQIGTLTTRVSQDTSEMESVLTVAAQFFLSNVLTLIGIAVVLCLLNWRLFLLVLIPAPFVAVLSQLAFKRIQQVWPRWWHARSLMNGVLTDSLSGIRVVRAFAQESQEISRFNPRSAALAQAGLNAESTWMTIFPLLNWITGCTALILTYAGGMMVLRHQTTLGTLLTFTAYLGMFLGPLQFLNRMAEWLGRALAAAERIFDILDSDPEVADIADAVPMPKIEGKVEFKEVVFGYDAHKPVLKGIDLDVAPGEMIGLVGHSGAGKSTLINLLCRFYDVNGGKVLIDGVPIRDIRQQDLRSQIGVVLQDTFLFNGTISENIRYAKPDATREEIMAAAKAANAHDFIVGKPDGYDTAVGERGQALSGGERQRISIARAILHNPRILILDEATSAVDTDTEKQIQDAIARLIKGRTTFAIAHRLSTLRNADRLVVLKGGKVEEIGTHDELIAKEGEFHRLVKIQQDMSKIQEIQR